jgi:hypothetical protein
VTVATEADLLTIAPAAAQRLLLYVATFAIYMHDQGYSNVNDGLGGTIDADTWLEYPNLRDMKAVAGGKLNVLAKGGTADLYCYWYKTR